MRNRQDRQAFELRPEDFKRGFMVGLYRPERPRVVAPQPTDTPGDTARKRGWAMGIETRMACGGLMQVWLIRGRTAVMQSRAQQLFAELTDPKRLRGKITKRPTREPCMDCEFIAICAASRRTCATFRAWVNKAGYKELRRMGHDWMRFPDRSWYESWLGTELFDILEKKRCKQTPG